MSKYLTSLTAWVVLISAGVVTSAVAQADPGPQRHSLRPVIELEFKGPIKVVYQVSEDKWQDGVSKAFLYLKKLRAYYERQGIDADKLDIRAVVHGGASSHVLTDAAYNRVQGVDTGNPNTLLLADLKKLGVHVEFCDSRRQQEGWAKTDIHPDVLLAKGAYARIIDLQLRGYAYIKF